MLSLLQFFHLIDNKLFCFPLRFQITPVNRPLEIFSKSDPKQYEPIYNWLTLFTTTSSVIFDFTSPISSLRY